MKLLCITLWLILANVCLVSAQRGSPPYSKWYLEPSIGANFSTAKFDKSLPSDHAIAYNEVNFYWRIPAVTYFLTAKWGISALLYAESSAGIADRGDRYEKEMRKEYENNFFISFDFDDVTSESGTQDGILLKSLAGICYRQETSDRVWLFKLFAGATAIDTDHRKTILKQRGTNRVFEVQHESSGNTQDFFTIAPGVTYALRISDRILWTFDFLYAYYRADITYTETQRDLFTNETTVTTIRYNEPVHSFSVGSGIIIQFPEQRW